MEIILTLLGVIVFVVVLIHLGSFLIYDRKVEYVKIAFDKHDLSPELNGYKMVFISDVHKYNLKKLDKIVDDINQVGVDLVLIGGDFPHREKAIPPIKVLAQINSTDGCYAVGGNHDNLQIFGRILKENKMTFLRNQGVRIRNGLFIAGVEDRWKGQPNIKAAIKGIKHHDCVILLTHNPDIVMEQSTEGIDMVLAGHTHGGELTLFGKFVPALTLTKHVTEYKKRFQGGLTYSKDNVPVYICQGLGSHFIRLFARPQILFIKLQNKKD